MSESANDQAPRAAPAPAAAPGFYPDPDDPYAERYWDGSNWTDEPGPSAPGPGFYPDPNDPQVERYWDGKKWTESRQPIRRAPGEKEQDASGVIIAGYIFAALMPLVGFIIGLTQINKNRHGIWVVVASAAAFVIWLAIFSGDTANGSA